MLCIVMREQQLGVLLLSISSRGLHENMTRSWQGMVDAHLEIPSHFSSFLARCMYACDHLHVDTMRTIDQRDTQISSGVTA